MTLALSLLEVLPDKDLRDTKGTILSDHLMNTVNPCNKAESGDKMFLEYVLNPRVANEIIAPWRSYFRNKLPCGLITGCTCKSCCLLLNIWKRISELLMMKIIIKHLLLPVGVK